MKVVYDAAKEAYVVILMADEYVTCIKEEDIVEARKEFIYRMTRSFNEAVLNGLTIGDKYE